MWEILFDKLIEHLPNIIRPILDRTFPGATVDHEAQRKNLEQFQQMTEGLRSDLAQATASHASLYRQLNEQGEKMSTLAADLHDSRAALQSAEARITRLEALLVTSRNLVIATLVFSVLTFAVVIYFHFHHMHH